jgi:hypothetical protein
MSQALSALAVIACSAHKLLDGSMRLAQRAGSVFLRAISMVTAEVQVAMSAGSLKFLQTSTLSPLEYSEMISLAQDCTLRAIQPRNVWLLEIVSPTLSKVCWTVGAFAFILMLGEGAFWVWVTSGVFPHEASMIAITKIRKGALNFIF